MRTRGLVASPVRQTPAILSEFLRGIAQVQCEDLDVQFYFIDDNVVADSSALLRSFQRENPDTTLAIEQPRDQYVCDDKTHHWSASLIWKVAAFKDRIIEEALRRDSDFLFLIDSDVVIPPQLLRHLVTLRKPVVSGVYWTQWEPDVPALPSVWQQDVYAFCARQGGLTPLEEGQAAAQSLAFLKMMRRPGTYRVGGLSGCTVISREALARGVRFSEIDNLSFWGEDRHFCVRARALGVELWADTRYPPLHIYRDGDLRTRVDVPRTIRRRLPSPSEANALDGRSRRGRPLARRSTARASGLHRRGRDC